ncbi:AB hydrolase-1 domain-containing protein [Tumidithrix helvetica PCC 7403]|uniref:alpha/beta fold hydrolase n=1 Tax=Tumidithrix helvetica TaxID=3457545 RepID=UPI003C8BFAF9
MSRLPEVVHLSTSQSLRRLDLPLLKQLSRYVKTSQWEYCQEQDEPSSMETALALLHDYLKREDRPVHLIGHSTGGLLGIMYAQKYPDLVQSLTILAVGVHPAIDWKVHYYKQRNLIPYSREIALTQMAMSLFNCQDRYTLKRFVEALEKDLDNSLSPHSLFQQAKICPSEVPVPLLVCGSLDDYVIDAKALQTWLLWFKQGDRLWECPQGNHFFHYFYPQDVCEQIIQFWNTLSYPLETLAPMEFLNMRS